jgi:methylmalonyl-CoA/ethylmalonyl-CoA epimerase
MLASSIGQIELLVEDLERAVAFYRDALGLRALPGSANLAFFDCGGVRLALRRAGSGGRNSVVYFKVDDIESAAAELQSRGGVLERQPHRVARFSDHDLWMAFFRDPDGNAAALMCERRP